MYLARLVRAVWKKIEANCCKSSLRVKEEHIHELQQALLDIQNNQDVWYLQKMLDDLSDILNVLHEALEAERKGKASRKNLSTAVANFFKILKQKYRLEPLGTYGQILRFDPTQHELYRQEPTTRPGELVKVIRGGWKVNKGIVLKPIVEKVDQAQPSKKEG